MNGFLHGMMSMEQVILQFRLLYSYKKTLKYAIEYVIINNETVFSFCAVNCEMLILRLSAGKDERLL